MTAPLRRALEPAALLPQRRHPRRARAVGQLADQQGFVLATAIMILFALLVLTGAAVDVATSVSQSTRRDDNSKAALEAAEAGLNVASFRIGKIKPAAGECINGSEARQAESECKSAAEALGNGASFQYWTSAELEANKGKYCAGEEVSEAGQRCITAVGEARGVTQRLQARIGGAGGFPYTGILALERFTSTNTEITGNLGSNGQITINNSSPKITGKVQYTNTGDVPTFGGGSCKGSCVEETTVARFAPTMAAGEASTYAAAAASNNDANVEYERSPGTREKGWPTQSEGSIYNPATHKLRTAGNLSGTLLFPAGTYYFCSIELNGSFTFAVASGPVKIYLDSPRRAGSPCENWTGNLSAGNEFNFLNSTGNPNNLQFYFWGEPPCTSSCPNISLNNVGTSASPLTATIFAPNSHITTGSSIHMDGALVVAEMSSNEVVFTTTNLGSSSGSQLGRKHWEQCTLGSGTSQGC